MGRTNKEGTSQKAIFKPQVNRKAKFKDCDGVLKGVVKTAHSSEIEV